MAKDKAYRQAEAKIEKAKKEGATELYLNSIGLTEIPSEIANLTQLQKLDLAFNHIKEIPAEITNLTQLRNLNLSINQISEIPTEIANPVSYTHLTLPTTPYV